VLALTFGALSLVGTAFSYDKELAKRFNAMFSQMTPEVLKQRPCQITTQQLLQMIQKGEDFIYTALGLRVMLPTSFSAIRFTLAVVFP